MYADTTVLVQGHKVLTIDYRTEGRYDLLVCRIKVKVVTAPPHGSTYSAATYSVFEGCSPTSPVAAYSEALKKALRGLASEEEK